MNTRKLTIDIPVFDEDRTYMLAALIDPQDNVQVLELDPDDVIKVDEYFAPCGNCGHTILLSHWGGNFEDSDFCAECCRPERVAEELVPWLGEEFNCSLFMSPDPTAGPFAILVFIDPCDIKRACELLNGTWSEVFNFAIQAANVITIWTK